MFKKTISLLGNCKTIKRVQLNKSHSLNISSIDNKCITNKTTTNYNYKFIYNEMLQQRQQQFNYNKSIQYTTSTTTTPLNEKILTDKINEIKKVDILPKDGVPQTLIDFKDNVLNYKDVNQLSNNTRLLSSRYLWKYLGITNASPSTIDKESLDKIWEYLDIDTSEIKDFVEKEAMELQQLVLGLHSRYLLGKLDRLMNDIIKRDLDTLSTGMIIQCFLISAHLSRWDDMKRYGTKVSNQIFEKLITEPYYNTDFFSYPTIYELLLNIENNLNKSPSIISTTQPSTIHPFTKFNIHSFGFKNPTVSSENVSNEQFTQFEKSYYDEMSLLKSKISDKDNYIIGNLGQINYATILGGAVKLYIELGGPQIVCGGVINKEHNKIQLLGKLNIENESKNLVEIHSEYNLEVVKNHHDSDTTNTTNTTTTTTSSDTISLIGTHTQSHKNLSSGNNETYIFSMDVKINLIKQQ